MPIAAATRMRLRRLSFIGGPSGVFPLVVDRAGWPARFLAVPPPSGASIHGGGHAARARPRFCRGRIRIHARRVCDDLDMKVVDLSARIMESVARAGR